MSGIFDGLGGAWPVDCPKCGSRYVIALSDDEPVLLDCQASCEWVGFVTLHLRPDSPAGGHWIEYKETTGGRGSQP